MILLSLINFRPDQPVYNTDVVLVANQSGENDSRCALRSPGLTSHTDSILNALARMNEEFSQLWHTVTKQFHTLGNSIHGPEHWKRVERNGLLLATRTGADITVVRLFALFHDSRRLNDDWDDGHGARGALYAENLRGNGFTLDDNRFELLRYACVWHTDGKHHDDPTIGTCWDADRLDLGRVGIIPQADFMSTAFGKKIAACGTIYPFLPKDG